MRPGWCLLMLLLLLPFVVAAPPFQVSDTTTELTIIYPKQDTVQVGVPVTLHTHVFNMSGLPVSNESTNCTLHIYSTTGQHTLREQMGFDGTEWELDINATVLEEIGSHTFIIYCYDGSVGGFASGSFMVTTDGLDEDVSFAWMLLAFLPFLFGFLVIIGARLFDPVEHYVLQVGAYLLGLVSSFAGLWWAVLTVIKFSEWPEMQEAAAFWAWTSGVMIAVIAFYWMIYIFYKIVETIRQKKERRLES